MLIDKTSFQMMYTHDLKMNFQDLTVKQLKIEISVTKKNKRFKNIKKYIHKHLKKMQIY